MAKPILIGIILAIIFVCILAGFSLFIRGKLIPTGSYKPPVITKLSIPTVTPTLISLTPGTDETQVVHSDVIAIGSYVQITGTGGVGLRIRLAPGTDSAPQFIARENEVFLVKDGPVEKDGINWWFLVASYDNSRQGWAAGQYLAVVDQPVD